MDRLLKLSKLETEPNSPDAGLVFKHWLQTFQRFFRAAREIYKKEHEESQFDAYGLLINYLAPTIYRYVEETEDYVEAIGLLKKSS